MTFGTWSSDVLPRPGDLPNGKDVFEELIRLGFDYKIVVSFVYCVHSNLGLVEESNDKIDAQSEDAKCYYNYLRLEFLDAEIVPNIHVHDPKGEMTAAPRAFDVAGPAEG